MTCVYVGRARNRNVGSYGYRHRVKKYIYGYRLKFRGILKTQR